MTLRPLVLLVLCLPACSSDDPPYGSTSTTAGVGGSGANTTGDGSGGESGAAGAGGAAGGAAGAAGAPGNGRPPATLRLTGTAAADVDVGSPGEGGAAGAPALPPIDRVECRFYADVLDLVPDDAGGWSGVAVGEVFRVVYSGERRFEFSAIFGGPSTLTLGPGDRVELRAVGDQTGAKPFWRELEVLEGETTADYTYDGSWTCASLELNDPGFPDHGGVASGRWELQPVD